jgi:uncharacterized phiE125 gp8 family phage protein
MGIVTASDVKAYLGKSDSDDDALLGVLCSAAQALAESYCNRRFDGADYTEYHDGGSQSIWVLNPPITSVSALYDSPDRSYSASDLVDPEDYVIYARRGEIRLDGAAFSEGPQTVKVVYKGGYGTGYAAVPADLKQALVEVAAKKWREGKKGEFGLVSRAFPDGSVAFSAEDLLPQIKLVLDRYRRLPGP